MPNKTIKLTESELRKIIENAVKNVIKEGIDKISLKHKTNLYLNFFDIYFKLENFLFFI